MRKRVPIVLPVETAPWAKFQWAVELLINSICLGDKGFCISKDIMKNRAKCKLCNSVIESFHATDYVLCKCGEISVDGGEALRCAANDWSNFIRVDDKGNEILVKIMDDVKQLDIDTKPTKKELLDMLERDIKAIEGLPQHAMLTPITHYDFCSSLMLLLAILRADESS